MTIKKYTTHFTDIQNWSLTIRRSLVPYTERHFWWRFLGMQLMHSMPLQQSEWILRRDIKISTRESHNSTQDGHYDDTNNKHYNNIYFNLNSSSRISHHYGSSPHSSKFIHSFFSFSFFHFIVSLPLMSIALMRIRSPSWYKQFTITA